MARSVCRGCDRMFASLGGFDKHRIGGYGDAIYDSKGRVTGYTPHNRHCMTEQELHDAGFATERKTVTIYLEGKPASVERDIWFSVADREAARAAFGRSADEEEVDD